jgi:Mg-chelatase subunit ChlD
VATNQAGMFETLLAAYRELQEGYDPSRSNTLIMWTDSGDTKAGGLTLAETLAELERMADVTRPIRVILLGLGPDADLAQLEAIATATGGGAFHLNDPDEIALVFLRALLT